MRKLRVYYLKSIDRVRCVFPVHISRIVPDVLRKLHNRRVKGYEISNGTSV